MAPESKGLVSIDFYPADKLPAPLKELASKQGKSFKRGLVAVRTRCTSPPKYDFDEVGSTPEEIKAFYEKLARDDGKVLDRVARDLLSGE
jgi:hypothetical protein